MHIHLSLANCAQRPVGFDCIRPIAALFACSGNARIGLYRHEKDATPTLCPSVCSERPNPFLSKPDPFLSAESHLQLIWDGCCLAQFGGSGAKNDRDRWGMLEASQIEVMIPRIMALGLESGIWAYLSMRYTDELFGGEVKEIDRTLPTVYKFKIDTSKPVPFLPIAVDFPNWKREIQC